MNPPLKPAIHLIRGALIAASLLSLPHLYADVTPASLFQDHAVLQAGKPLSVWGRADPGEQVTVTFAGQTVATTASAAGTWKAVLASLPVSREPATLTIAGRNIIVLRDVLVGEVWLCAGQSNMEFKLRRVTNADAEISAANFPLIRQFKVQNRVANSPLPDAKGSWTACSPANAGNFTAVGYFFARDIHQQLGVPVGIIDSSWGGTEIEAWASQQVYAAHPQFNSVAARWKKRLADYPQLQAAYAGGEAEDDRKSAEAKARGEIYQRRWRRAPAKPDGSPHEDKPSAIFNGMIHPLLTTSLAGFLWYQGESNTARAAEYHELFPALITDWRAGSGQGDLPFYWVQLPNYRGSEQSQDWAELREAQSAALALPATGQAIAIDVGEVNDIHPRNKQPVGHRLALLALAKTYGQPTVFRGPQFVAANFQPGFAKITFDSGGGSLQPANSPLTGFELAGPDHIFHAASATIDGEAVVVRCAQVPAPVAVRYAWTNAPTASLANTAGLPAAPFRSTSW